ncbi:hypothetical protein F0U61_44255 [Archangium violaceum]|uniref:hypothetical protein n=1 Tax=Archangium violaceum TaxID=83451 RepID=UPI002B2F0480|nr:hypothetical protein F0U61_44255 [Archangium violaceum]
MSLAKNLIFVVLAASLTACGGAELEQNETEPVTPPAGEQTVDGTGDDGTVSALAACDGGHTYCYVECYEGTGYWYNVGHISVVGDGNCIEAGRAFCASYGWTRKGSCWGY